MPIICDLDPSLLLLFLDDDGALHCHLSPSAAELIQPSPEQMLPVGDGWRTRMDEDGVSC